MTDRAVELAAALMLSVEKGTRVAIACERLINRWTEQDLERATSNLGDAIEQGRKEVERPTVQSDLLARLRNPSIQSWPTNKDNMREAADELTATRKACNDMGLRLSTALEQLGIVSSRLGSAQQAIRELLHLVGWEDRTEDELQQEQFKGGGAAPVILRARAVLFDIAEVKVVETPKPDAPDRPRCETCQHWDNSATLDNTENTGMCRAALPERDKRTGRAVWPFSEDADSCPSHNPSDF